MNVHNSSSSAKTNTPAHYIETRVYEMQCTAQSLYTELLFFVVVVVVVLLLLCKKNVETSHRSKCP